MTEEKIHIHVENKNPLVTENGTFSSSQDYSLTKEELEKARNELHETEERRNSCLQNLKARLSEDGCKKYVTDDNYLLKYLRFRKFDCDEAYQTIKNFNSIKESHPEMFENLSSLKTLLNQNCTSLLPYTDEQGRLLLEFHIGKLNPEEVSHVAFMAATAAMAEVITTNPKCQINGIAAICNLKGVRPAHISTYMSPSQFKLFASLFQNTFPWRIKLVILFNCHQLAKIVYSIARPFLKKKIRDRIIVLGSDLKELHQYINPALLPMSLGGTLGNEESYFTPYILNNMHYLKYLRALK